MRTTREQWERAHGWFAYELASGVLTALVLSGTLRKSAANALINDCLNHLSEQHPDLKEELQEIAAKGTAQIEMLSLQSRQKD
jgi:hypothetical protein